jgi:FkbM family methyltransferase
LSPQQQLLRDGDWNYILGGLSLSDKDTVLDFGGFTGDLTANINQRFGCKVHVFEPISQFSDHLRTRFGNNPMVEVHSVAVGARERTATMGLSSDGTGTFAKGATVPVSFVTTAYLDTLGSEHVALAVVNIEGGEYELIPALGAADWLRRIDRLLIQFHHVTPDSHIDRAKCQELLALAHRQEWDYPFVWESWAKRGT